VPVHVICSHRSEQDGTRDRSPAPWSPATIGPGWALPLSIYEPRKGDRDRDNGERDQHPTLNLEAENREVPVR